jgi:hypothetical protein
MKIKQTRYVAETTLTESKDDERVIRFVTRGTSNIVINVFESNGVSGMEV